jgi:hypothetical protein
MPDVNAIPATIPGASNSTFLQEEAKRRMIAAQLLQQQASDASQTPVFSTGAGIAKLGAGLLGGYMEGVASKEMRQAQESELAMGRELQAKLLGVSDAPAATTSAPTVPAITPSPAAGSMEPRGFRNNNPLNIEAGGFTQGQPGFAGSDGRFAKFASMDQGVAAANTLLDTYQNKHGLNTPAAIIGRWAPSNDGNNVSAYASTVANQLGIGPNDPIPPEMRPKLIQAMAQVENGKPLPSVSPQAIGQALTAPQAAQTGPSNEVLIQALNNRYTAPLAQQIMANKLKPRDQWTDERGSDGSFYQRNSLTGERKVIEKSDVLPKAAVDQKIAIAAAAKPETTINNTVSPILKGVGDRFNETMDKARGSVTQIQGIHEARKALDEGAITGAGADPKLFLSKAAGLFGVPSKMAENTEVLRAAVGNSVLEKAKTLGANPSNADRDYIEKVSGGSIALEEGSMRRLLDMQEKWAREAIKRANDDGSKVLAAQPKELAAVSGLLRVEEPGTYEDFLKSNPVKKAAPTIQLQPGQTATNPKTGERLILQNGKWVPMT